MVGQHGLLGKGNARILHVAKKREHLRISRERGAGGLIAARSRTDRARIREKMARYW
mgnify:CR=1 FL=1